MKHLLAFIIVIGIGSLCFAQQAKVIKVKGQQAIVEFPDDVKPKVGQVVEVGPGGSSTANTANLDAGIPGVGGRDHTVGISAAQFSYFNSSVTNKNTTALQLQGRFGWNLGQFEVGPIVGLSYSSTESISAMSFGGGGFVDVNLTPNQPGVDFVFGIGAEGMASSISQKVLSKETSSTEMTAAGGGFVKWFIPRTTVALRGDLDFYYDRITLGSTNTDTTGPLLKAGFQVYF